MSETIHATATSGDVQRIVAGIVQGLAGSASQTAIVQGIQLRAGVVLLTLVQRDFVTKSRGGTGLDGVTWKKLKRSTIAQRRTTRGEMKALGIKGKRVRGLLTPGQDKEWRQIFAREKARLMAKFGMGAGEAGAKAAAKAWAILKEKGAQTKLDVLGSRTVDILRDTGELLRSLTPGVAGASSADGQIFETPPGRVIVGTNKKPWHHKQRPFWPADGDLPDAYWDPIIGAFRRGILDAVVMELST